MQGFNLQSSGPCGLLTLQINISKMQGWIASLNASEDLSIVIASLNASEDLSIVIASLNASEDLSIVML
jgi:hypothetical protein